MNKVNYPASLMLICTLLSSSIACAETLEPELSPSLKLDLPFIRYHPIIGGDQFYWATMKHLPSSNGRLLFEVDDYGLLQESEISRRPALKPLQEVITDKPPIINPISANQAQLIFTSAIPLACSVVYGTTMQFGSIAVDQDMSGGAHSNHSPILSGLQTDTTYYYRIQGTASDGTMYWSDTESYRTPAENSNTDTNLASVEAGANIVAVSSNFGNGSNTSTWGAEKAIDGSAASAWSSYGDGNDAYLEIGLAQRAQIKTIGVWSRSMADGTAKIFSFTVTSDDGTVFGPFDLPDTHQMYTFAVSTETQSLRLDVITSSGGNTGLIEFAAY